MNRQVGDQEPQAGDNLWTRRFVQRSPMVFEHQEEAMRIWINGRSELLLGFYVIAWVVALVLTHMLAR